MCPDVITIERIRAQDSTQVLLAEYYEVLNALAADPRGGKRDSFHRLGWRSGPISFIYQFFGGMNAGRSKIKGKSAR